MKVKKAIEQLYDLKRDRQAFLESDPDNEAFLADIAAIDMAIACLREEEKKENEIT